MQRAAKVMLLIDADNVAADVIDQAVGLVVAEHGAAHVRRAYCTAELALKHLKLFKAHSIRPIVNISTGKNSTDIALAIDAMDLVVAERPDVVVLVSSDSDFAPLVIRLREKGCRVEGIGQEGKTGEDSKPVYDHFVDLPYRRPRAGDTSSSAAPRPAAKRGRGGAASGRRGAPTAAVSRPAAQPSFSLASRSAAPAPTRPASTPTPVPPPAPVMLAEADLTAVAPPAMPEVVPEMPEASIAEAPPARKVAAKKAAAKTAAAKTAAGKTVAAKEAVAKKVATKAPAKKAAARKAAAKKAPAKKAPAKKAPAKKAATKKAAATEALPTFAAEFPEVFAPPPPPPPPPAAPVAPAIPDEVARILAALPELRAGTWLDLSQAKERLLRAGLLARSAPSTKLFRRHPSLFALSPADQPNRVQFLGER